jgi:hypothetical protein
MSQQDWWQRDWWSRFCEWLTAPPRSKRIEPGAMVFLGWKERSVGNQLRGTLAFASLPSGYEGEIVAREIEVIVNGASRGAEMLEVARPNFEFDVVQGDAVRVEYRYVDDAGNRSESAQVLDFVASDTTPPPNPSDGTLSFVEKLDSGSDSRPDGALAAGQPAETVPAETALDPPAAPVSGASDAVSSDAVSSDAALEGGSLDAPLGAPLAEPEAAGAEAGNSPGDAFDEAAL